MAENVIDIFDNQCDKKAYWINKKIIFPYYADRNKSNNKEKGRQNLSCGTLTDIKPIEEIGDTPISALIEESKDENGNSNLLLFPSSFDADNDLLKNNAKVFDYENRPSESLIHTHNIMGFVSWKGVQINIHSRFAHKYDVYEEKKNNKPKFIGSGYSDFFLQYMLSKVLNFNFFNLEVDKSQTPILNITAILFPYYLKRAWRKGIFKKYRTFTHNDANIRGVIDVTRHIRQNIPFMGNVAYNTREYSVDNYVTQLVRHAIEYLRLHSDFKEILVMDPEMKQAVIDICQATPTFNYKEQQKILNLNIRPISHPYYQEYSELQSICKLILQNGRLSYGNDNKNDNKIFGVLFDGANIWEDYIAVVLKNTFEHFERKNSDFHLLTDSEGHKSIKIVPDYLSLDRKFVADAKYIHLDTYMQDDTSRNMEIYYKTVMYMKRFNSNVGFLFYPKDNDSTSDKAFQIDDFGNESDKSFLIQVSLDVPQITDKMSYKDFKEEIQKSEERFRGKINESIKLIREGNVELGNLQNALTNKAS